MNLINIFLTTLALHYSMVQGCNIAAMQINNLAPMTFIVGSPSDFQASLQDSSCTGGTWTTDTSFGNIPNNDGYVILSGEPPGGTITVTYTQGGQTATKLFYVTFIDLSNCQTSENQPASTSQKGSSTQTIQVTAAYGNPDCTATSWSLSPQPTGVSISSSGLITIQKTAAISSTTITVLFQISLSPTDIMQGSVVVEVIDCEDSGDVSWSMLGDPFSILMGASQPSDLTGVASNWQSPCPITSYSMTSQAGVTIAIDPTSGAITLDTSTAFASTSLTITAMLGDPQIGAQVTKTFSIAVVDCSSAVTFDMVGEPFTIQLGGSAPSGLTGQTTSSNSACTVSSHSITTTPQVSIVSSNGKMSVDTTNALALTSVTITATDGSNTFTKVFTIEIIDCTVVRPFDMAASQSFSLQMGEIATSSLTGTASFISTATSTEKATCPILLVVMTSQTGVTIEDENGSSPGTIIVDTSAPIAPATTLTVSISLGTSAYAQTFTRSFTLEVYNCLVASYYQFSWSLLQNRAQVNSTFTIDASATSSDSSCTRGAYSLSYSGNDIAIDGTTGLITVNTTSAIAPQSIVQSIAVGPVTQTYQHTASNTIEVFDCTSSITFPALKTSYTTEHEATFPVIDPTPATSDDVNCPITVDSYSLTTDAESGLATFVSVDERGSFSVDTSAEKPSTSLTVSVKVGSQYISSPSFTVTITKKADCSPYLSFPQMVEKFDVETNYYVFLAMKTGSDIKINANAQTSDSSCAIGNTYNISNQPENSSFDKNTGILTTPVASITSSPYYLNITAGIGDENTVIAMIMISLTSSVNFSPSFLESLVSWEIIKGSNNDSDTQYFYFTPQMIDQEQEDITYEIDKPIGLKNLQERFVASNNSLVFTLDAEDLEVGDYEISIKLRDSSLQESTQGLKVFVGEETQEKEEQKLQSISFEEGTLDSLKANRTAQNGTKTEEKVPKPPPPRITKKTFKPHGELSVRFNKDMAFLDPYSNLDDTIEILLEAPEFDSWVQTKWTSPPENITDARRKLKRNLEQQDDDLDQLDGIAWYVKDQTSREYKFQLLFCEIDQARHFENVDVQFKENSGFKSADGVSIDSKDQPSMLKPIYMLIEEGQSKQIEQVATTVKAATVTSGILTLVLSRLMGAGMQYIWAMMTVLQEICFNALINTKYQPLVMFVMTSMMMFAKVDVISLENYWADNWLFVETAAVNYKFDIQGMDSKNFLVNTGSMLVNFLGMLLLSCIFQVLFASLKKKAESSRNTRKVLMYNLAPSVLTGTIMFLYQFSTDAIICSTLQFRAYADMGMEVFLEHPGDIINMVGSIAIFVSVAGVTMFALVAIHRAEDLDDPDFQIQNFMFVDGLDLGTKARAQFNNIVILRYLMNASIFVWLDSGCLQSQILLFSSLHFLRLLRELQPHDSALGNRVGEFNEAAVYLTLCVQFFMSDPSQPTHIQDILGITYTVLVILALISNFCVAIFQMYTDYKEERRLKNIRKEFVKRWKELHKELQNKKARKAHKYFQVLEQQKVRLEMKDLNAGLESNGWRAIAQNEPKVEAKRLPQQKQVQTTPKVTIFNHAIMQKSEEAEAIRDQSLDDASQEKSSTVQAKFATNRLGRPNEKSFKNRKKQKTTLEGIKLANKSRQKVALTIIQEEQLQNTERQDSNSSHVSFSLEKSDSLSPASGSSSEEEEKTPYPRKKENINDIGLVEISSHSQRSQSRQGVPIKNSTKQRLEVDRKVSEKIVEPKSLIKETIKKKNIPQRLSRRHKDFDQSDEIKRLERLQAKDPDDLTIFEKFDKLSLPKVLRQQKTYNIKVQIKFLMFQKQFPFHQKGDPELKERKFQIFKLYYDQKMEDNYHELLSKDMMLPPVKFTEEEMEFTNLLCLAEQ